MAIANNTIKTRIQLKSDTETNWNKAGPKNGNPGFIPLRGELIIYLADETHAFSRLKVGDGETNVVDLPFIDADSIGGMNINNLVAKRVQHKLIFGSGGVYEYDGSEDVTVPVYTGGII